MREAPALPEGVRLDDAGSDDLDALVALEQACASHPWTREHFADALDDPIARVLVLRAAPGSEPALIGLCVLARVAAEAEIHDLAVHPAFRRRGLARALVEHALREAARAGARTCWLEVRIGNRAARALYDALGFAAAGRRRGYYSAPAEDALRLRRDLEFAGGAC